MLSVAVGVTGPADAASGRQTESALSVMTGVADAAHGGSRLLRDRTEVFFFFIGRSKSLYSLESLP